MVFKTSGNKRTVISIRGPTKEARLWLPLMTHGEKVQTTVQGQAEPRGSGEREECGETKVARTHHTWVERVTQKEGPEWHHVPLWYEAVQGMPVRGPSSLGKEPLGRIGSAWLAHPQQGTVPVPINQTEKISRCRNGELLTLDWLPFQI